ncbi:hypothetical protein D9M71_601570 [compost metagenome]
MPTLSDVTTFCPSPRRIGRRMLAMIFSAMRWASSRLCRGVSSTANSSPPRRATRSFSRSCARTRVATLTSTSSPAAWPWLSLMSLKLSLSRNSSAMCSRYLLALRSVRLSRPSKKARLGKPVKLSWLAWWARLSFSLCRWLCQLSSSSSKALKSLPSSLSSAICASGTRRSKLRSRRAA